MHQPLLRGLAAKRRQLAVGEVGNEEDIVLGYRGAQQRRPGVSEAQPVNRQQAGVMVEQAMAAFIDIAIAIGHQERVPILEYLLVVERDGRGRFHDQACMRVRDPLPASSRQYNST